MNKIKASPPAQAAPTSMRLREYARTAILMTVMTATVTIVVGLIQGGREVWSVAGLLILIFTVAIWCATIAAGCLYFFVSWTWDFGKRLARDRRGKATAKGRVWDDWIDGPRDV